MTYGLQQFGTCDVEGFPSFRHTTIASPRLLLRAPRIEDFEQWRTLRKNNRDHLQPFEPTWSENWDAREAYQDSVLLQKTQWRAGRSYGFLIFDRYEDTMIGGINIDNVVRGSAQFASLGYWICKTREGDGMMSEAMDVSLTFCRHALKLARVNAATLAHNARSQTLLERFSFEKEGVAKSYLAINGTRQDHILYGLSLSSEDLA